MRPPALAEAPEGARLAVVFEPAGPAWMPITVFFARRGLGRGHPVDIVAADLRRHAKSNGIDAETLPASRWPIRPGGTGWSCPGRTRRRWTGASGLVTG